MEFRIHEYVILRRSARLRLLEMHYRSGVGHIGGNLSCLDMLLVLYHHKMLEHDQFVLSKGHAAGALYIALWSIGQIEDGELSHFHKDNTRLSGHPPPRGLPAVEFATGSLGHGLSLAAGLALGRLLKGESGHVYCVLSDGEWDEGSNWEALLFATHRRLNNLTLLIDLNGMQGFGSTSEVANLEPFGAKFRSFGAEVHEIDGHNPVELLHALAAPATNGGPKVIIARTKKGCGVSFMEGRMEWHYLPLNETQYKQATGEIECA